MKLDLIYYLLMAKYANSVIASSDENRFKYQLYSIIFQYGPTWAKELEVQKDIRKLTIEDFQKGSVNIVNNAQNPSTQPAGELLEFINSQNVSKITRSKADGYALMLSLLKDDVTESFLKRFQKLFLTIVQPEKPFWYVTDADGTEQQTDLGNLYGGVSLYGNFRQRYFSQIFPTFEEFEEEWNETVFAEYLMED